MARLLIIDDSAFSRKMLRAHLEKAGHEVLEAGDGLSALEAYSLQKPDLVTLDLTMTGMHGLDVLSQLRSLDSRARVLLATADIQSSTRDLGAAGGASGFIQKPFVADDVVQRVEAVLRGEVAW
jgi:two-component system chemotaxis response regulator CheY